MQSSDLSRSVPRGQHVARGSSHARTRSRSVPSTMRRTRSHERLSNSSTSSESANSDLHSQQAQEPASASGSIQTHAVLSTSTAPRAATTESHPSTTRSAGADTAQDRPTRRHPRSSRIDTSGRPSFIETGVDTTNHTQREYAGLVRTDKDIARRYRDTRVLLSQRHSPTSPDFPRRSPSPDHEFQHQPATLGLDGGAGVATNVAVAAMGGETNEKRQGLRNAWRRMKEKVLGDKRGYKVLSSGRD